MTKQVTFEVRWPRTLLRRAEDDAANRSHMRFSAWLEKAALHELEREPNQQFLLRHLREEQEAWRGRYYELLRQLQELIDASAAPQATVIALAGNAEGRNDLTG